MNASLVGGTTLTGDGAGITSPAAEYRATITAVDRENEVIEVFPAPEDVESLVGQYLFITNPDCLQSAGGVV